MDHVVDSLMVMNQLLLHMVGLLVDLVVMMIEAEVKVVVVLQCEAFEEVTAETAVTLNIGKFYCFSQLLFRMN